MTEWLHFHFSLSCIGEGNGNPLQCSCLENPRDGGAWWAAVCGVAQSRTLLKRFSSSSSSSPTWLVSLQEGGIWHTHTGHGGGQRPVSVGERLQEKPALPAPGPLTFGVQNSEMINSCYLSPPLCGTLLHQPQQTNTVICCFSLPQKM